MDDADTPAPCKQCRHPVVIGILAAFTAVLLVFTAALLVAMFITARQTAEARMDRQLELARIKAARTCLPNVHR